MLIYDIPTSMVAVTFLLLTCSVIYRQLFANSLNHRLPPGPKPLPLLGNILEVPHKHKERKLAEWGKVYGDIVYTRFLRTPVVILNSLDVAQDLLDKRSSLYSDRPSARLISDFVGWENGLTGIPYGDRSRKHRKWIHDSIGSKDSLRVWLPLQRREVCTLIIGLCDKPELFNAYINRFAAALLVEIGYGHTITSLDDMYVHLADKAVVELETVEGGYPGLMTVDFLPTFIFKITPSWFPGPVGRFVRKAASVKIATDAMHNTPYQMVKDSMTSGTSRPSIVASLLKKLSARGELTTEDEDDIKGTAGVLYGAGAETLVSVLQSFLLAMMLYPGSLRKAQEEIDKVLGPDRLPEFDDRKALPYTECVLQELYRWGCPAPTGLAHRLIEDDEYKGYHIPAGSTVIANIWYVYMV